MDHKSLATTVYLLLNMVAKHAILGHRIVTVPTTITNQCCATVPFMFPYCPRN